MSTVTGKKRKNISKDSTKGGKKGGSKGVEKKKDDAKKVAEEGARKRAKQSHVSGKEMSDFATELNRLTGSIMRKEREDEKAREEEVAKLFAELKGKFVRFSGRHDLARAIQCCFRFGTEEMRDTVLSELEGKLRDLSKDRYACYSVIAFLRYGNEKQRVKILNEFRTHAYKLATHSCASNVLEFAFSHCDIDYSKTKASKKRNNAQKTDSVVSARSVLTKLRMEFYGREFAIFAQSELDEPKKMFKTLDLKKRRIALSNMADRAMKMAEKSILRHSFAHSVVYTLIQHCEDNIKELEGNNEDGAEKEKKIIEELIPLVIEACLAMISSADGAAAVSRCIAHADPKARKKFIRILKGHIPNLLFHEFGYVVLLTLVNVVDDTVFMKKNLIPELADPKVLDNLVAITLSTDVDKISESRAVFLQILAPTKKCYILQKDATLMTPAPGTSKKEPEARGAELTAALIDGLTSACTGQVSQMIRVQRAADLLLEVILSSWSQSLLEEVAKVVADDTVALLEDPVAHRFIKRIVVAENEKSGQDKDAFQFAPKLLDVLAPKLKELVEINRACFVMAAIAESTAKTKLVTALKPFNAALKASTLKGAQALLAALKKK